MSGLLAMQIVAFLAGASVFGGIVGLYALLARSFPAELRVTGTGLAIGIGRGGAVVGPVLGGILIQAGMSIPLAIAIVGAGALIAAGILVILWIVSRQSRNAEKGTARHRIGRCHSIFATPPVTNAAFRCRFCIQPVRFRRLAIAGFYASPNLYLTLTVSIKGAQNAKSVEGR